MIDHPIMIMDLVQKYVCTPEIEKDLPEFSFVWQVAQKVKNRGCYCGINSEIVKLIPLFNLAINNLSQEGLQKIQKIFNRQNVSFGIIKDNKFEIKIYP